MKGHRDCQKCGSPTRMMGYLYFSAPSEFEHNLTRKNLRSKDFEVWAVLWESMDFICTKCGHIDMAEKGFNQFKNKKELTNDTK